MARDVAVRQISDEARPISFKGVALLFVSKEEIVRQRCRCCGGRFDREAGFRKRKLDISSYDTHPDCILCEQTERDKKKADRWLIKARDTVRRHAQHDKLTAREFTSRFGWDVKRVAHILEHAYGNTCEYCRELYSLMPSGLQSITMDIIDREKPPHLETNTKPCCQTCNRKKSKWSPERWARHLRYAAEWEARQQEIKETGGGLPKQLSFNLSINESMALDDLGS